MWLLVGRMQSLGIASNLWLTHWRVGRQMLGMQVGVCEDGCCSRAQVTCTSCRMQQHPPFPANAVQAMRLVLMRMLRHHDALASQTCCLTSLTTDDSCCSAGAAPANSNACCSASGNVAAAAARSCSSELLVATSSEVDMLLLGLVPVLLLLLTLAARAACTVGCKLSRNPGMGMASDTCLQVQQQPKNSSKPNSQRRFEQVKKVNTHRHQLPNKCSPAPATLTCAHCRLSASLCRLHSSSYTVSPPVAGS